MSPQPAHPELLCIVCSGGQADENGASTICALCSIGEAAPAVRPAPVPARLRIRKKTSPELQCIICSGGRKDTAGRYTVCALCSGDVPDALPAAA